MNDVLQAARELQTDCMRQGWKFCFIGGIAVQRWGEPRLTVDADLTLLTGFEREEAFIRLLLESFEGRIPDAAGFALKRRVLLLRASNGVGLDVALAGLPFEAEMIRRSSLFEFPGGAALRTCSAEDLIVLKSFAGRERDWADVRGVIERQGESLDWSYILGQLRPLTELKEEPGILERLLRIREERGG